MEIAHWTFDHCTFAQWTCIWTFVFRVFCYLDLYSLSKYPPTSIEAKCEDFPYLCCVAMLFCTLGGITFSVSIHKVTDLILLTLQEIFHSSYEWLEIAEILSTACGCLIAALSILVFSATCISIYHNNQSGTAQLVLMVMTYPSLFIWGFFVT